MFDDKNPQQPQIRVTEYKKPESLTDEIRSRSQNRPSIARVSRRWIWIIAIVAAVVVLGALALFIRSQQQLKAVKKDLEQVQSDPSIKTKEANKQLIEQVGKLIALPKDEEPTIATVSDLSKLQGQPFFANAQIGDKVLIYQIAGKAILFRASDNKIIELAPINKSGQTGTPTTTPTDPAAPTTTTPPATTPAQ